MAFVLTGCNTVKGVGKDVSKAGEAVTGTAEKLLKKSVKTKLFLASPQTLSQIGFLCGTFTLQAIFAYHRADKFIDL